MSLNDHRTYRTTARPRTTVGCGEETIRRLHNPFKVSAGGLRKPKEALRPPTRRIQKLRHRTNSPRTVGRDGRIGISSEDWTSLGRGSTAAGGRSDDA